MNFKIYLFIIFFITHTAASEHLEKVTLKLNWKYQFQFAGIIAAKEKGFYKELGLDVQVIEKIGHEDFIGDMVTGKYDYVLSGSRLFFHKDLKKIKVLANYFKQSPFAFVSKKDILSFSSLKNKNVMTTKMAIEMDSIALLFDKYNMSEKDINLLSLSYNDEDYLRDDMDAMGLFMTDQLYYLDKKGVPYNLFSPSNYGLNTPEMNLVSSNETYQNHKNRTLKMIQATNKGWNYALKNKDEIIKVIYDKYSTRKSVDSLRYEANKIEEIFLKDLFAIGEIDMNFFQTYFNYLHTKKNINIDFTKLIHKTGNLELSENENKWKSKQKYLDLIVDELSEPFVYWNKEKQTYEGLLVDYGKLIAKNLNLELRYIKKKDAKEVLKVDFLTLNSLEITNKDNTEENFKESKKITDNLYIKNYFDEKNIIISKNTEEIFNKIKNTNNIFFLTNEITGKYWMKSLGKNNFKVIKSSTQQIPYYISFSANNSLDAYSSIKKSISFIGLEKRRELYLKWTLYNEKVFDYELLYKISAFVFLIITIVLYFNYRLKQKVQQRTEEINRLLKNIEHDNKTLELKVKERTKILEETKNEKEVLLEKTMDSLKYASFLQSSIISDKNELQSFFDDSFIIWEPRDIVGGDIYFAEFFNEKKELLLFVIDCTGHGVHGALLTMLVKAIQKQIVNEYKNIIQSISPAKILRRFNELFVQIIRKNEKNLDIGFEGGVLYINKDESICKYAGAKTSLFLVQNEKLEILKGNRIVISNKNIGSLGFDEYTIIIDSNTKFYLTTDGFIDQNGGENGFPFGKKHFVQLIKSNEHLDFATQKKNFIEAIDVYANFQNRNDDICFLGFKL